MALQTALRAGRLFPKDSALFVCDVQERFRNVINHMPAVIQTSKFMIKSAQELQIPIVVTEQNPRALGKTVDELESIMTGNPKVQKFSKMKFSMVIPEVSEMLKKEKIKSILLVGIEAHVCVFQTAQDLVEEGYDVHIIADGVSSQRSSDRKIAFERMKQFGAFITTSESAVFQMLRSAEHPSFKPLQPLFKEEHLACGLE
eukprot:TRINITY_DN9113_c0_g1_i1.p1 TRINITY_DN9113_c0_g1~~TRINITY_DN9113_c0_g1_i1.p1  ORF type:complete len:201 (-),score=30.68 TRINITY_DN9113_c0_g1_i1:29-631(-)